MYVGHTEQLWVPLFREKRGTTPISYKGHTYLQIGYALRSLSTCEKVKQVFAFVFLLAGVLCTLGIPLCYSSLRQHLYEISIGIRHGGKLIPVYRMWSPSGIPYKQIQLHSISSLYFSSFQEDQERKIIAEACERARKLCASDKEGVENLELQWGEIATLYSEHASKKFFDMIVEYLQNMGTTPLDQQVTGYDSLNKSIGDAITNFGIKDPKHRELFLKWMKACLLEIPNPTREKIVDHIGEETLLNKYFPIYDAYGAARKQFFRLIQSVTTHCSPRQLVMSVYTDDATRLRSCLDQGISPYVRLEANCVSESSYPLLEFAAWLNSHRSLNLLLKRDNFAFEDNVLWCTRLAPEIVNVLWERGIPLYDHLPSQNVLAALYFHDSYEQFVTVLKAKPKFLLLKRPAKPSLIEEIYAEVAQSKPDKLRYFEGAFIAYTTVLGSQLSSAILSDMKQRILQGEHQWLRFLPTEDRTAMESLIKNAESPLSRMTTTRLKLENELIRHNLDPENIDAELIFTAYILKKEVKKLLQSPENSGLRGEYDHFVRLYDEVARKHPLWSILKKHSKDFRRGTLVSTPVQTIDQFFSLFNIPSATREEKAKVWRVNAAMVHKRAVLGFAQLRRRSEHERCITLMHGTKSPTIALICQSADYAIKPSGAVSCTFTGEGSAAIGGVNTHSVSTARADRQWGCKPDFVWNSCFAVALAYACNDTAGANIYERSHERPLTCDPSSELKLINDAVAVIIHEKNNRFSPEMVEPFWFDFQRAIKRMKVLKNKEFMEETASIRLQLESCAKEYPSDNLKECLALWNSEPSLTVDPKSPLFTTHYPVLLTSSQFREESMDLYHAKDSNIHRGEILVRGAIPIGTGGTGSSTAASSSSLTRVACAFNTVYTTSEGIPVLEAHLKAVGATVLSLDAFSTQAIMQMSTVARTTVKSRLEEESKISFEDICLDFHQYILPGYAKPFTLTGSRERPFYGRGNPTYEAYIAEVNAGNRLPRDIHGAMHSSRVALFSLMCMNIYASVGKKLNVSESILVQTAGAHDIARQDEGVDRWDAESGKWMRWFADRVLRISRGETLDEIENAIAHKDSSKPEHETVLQGCIQGGDCIDILRCLDSSARFDFKHLKFVNLPELATFPREQALREWADFIGVTENLELRRHMERYSQNYLWDLFLIFKLVHGEKRFPIMYQYLKTQCEQVTGTLPDHYAPIIKSIMAR